MALPKSKLSYHVVEKEKEKEKEKERKSNV